MTKPYPQFHAFVDEVSKSLYESGHFTEALRSASTKLEEYCKEILGSMVGSNEYFGQVLVTKLFSYTKEKQDGEEIERPPLIVFYNISTKVGRSKQVCMYKIDR
jgi:hypothetical protein